MILKLLLGLLIAPWIVVVGVVRFVLALFKWPRQLAARSADTIPCPAGHANALLGRWSCGCGANYLGHAFAPCPICGIPAGWMRCETCGLAIRSPWKNET